MANKKVIVEAKGLKKTFTNGKDDQTILEDLNLKIYKEDFTIIMGNSGSGKSTLLFIISGMDKPTAGSIHFKGEDISRYSDDQLSIFRRNHCGFIFQQAYLLDNMNAVDNILTSAYLKKQNKQDVIMKTKAYLKKVGIEEAVWGKLIGSLSGGEAQRVGIVRALINSPSMLFADEPTGALNSATSSHVLDIMTTTHKEDKQSIVMVTHDFKTALRGNRVIYLKDGEITGECDLGFYTGTNQDREKHLTSFLAKMGW